MGWGKRQTHLSADAQSHPPSQPSEVYVKKRTIVLLGIPYESSVQHHYGHKQLRCMTLPRRRSNHYQGLIPLQMPLLVDRRFRRLLFHFSQGGSRKIRGRAGVLQVNFKDEGQWRHSLRHMNRIGSHSDELEVSRLVSLCLDISLTYSVTSVHL